MAKKTTTIDLETKRVTATFKTKRSKDDVNPVETTVTFDLSETREERILGLAIDSYIIVTQREMRASNESLESWDGKTVKVVDAKKRAKKVPTLAEVAFMKAQLGQELNQDEAIALAALMDSPEFKANLAKATSNLAESN